MKCPKLLSINRFSLLSVFAMATLVTASISGISAFAQEPVTDSTTAEEKKTDAPKQERRDFWDYIDIDESGPDQKDYVDKSLEFVLSKSHLIANWVDGFFDDSRSQDVKNQTRLKLSYWGFWDKEDKYNDDNFNYSIKVKFPRFENKLQLFLGNEDDDESARSTSGGVFPDQVNQDDTFLGIRTFDLFDLKDKMPGQFSTSFGVSYNDSKINYRIEPRYTYRHDWDKWSLYFRQKVKYSSRDKWQTETRLDFDRALSSLYFFRLSNELFWEQENDDFDGYEYYIRPIISRRLRGRQALLYEWNNRFRDKPEHDLQATGLTVRYRRQVWKPWFFVEAAPTLTWRKDDDWKTSPGIFLKAEILMKLIDK
jgi:hypothetical protein